MEAVEASKQDVKKHAVVVSLVTNHAYWENADLLNVTRSFVFNPIKELPYFDMNAFPVAKRKKISMIKNSQECQVHAVRSRYHRRERRKNNDNHCQ